MGYYERTDGEIICDNLDSLHETLYSIERKLDCLVEVIREAIKDGKL